MTPNSILESILNPSSDIKQGYETVIVTKTDGEVLSGTLYRKTDSATLLRQANGEILSIPAAEITKVDVSPVSLMPQGLTASLHRDELRDLIYYLTHLGVPQSL
jgi:putative heme-binding domain-containing protein